MVTKIHFDNKDSIWVDHVAEPERIDNTLLFVGNWHGTTFEITIMLDKVTFMSTYTDMETASKCEPL